MFLYISTKNVTHPLNSWHSVFWTIQDARGRSNLSPSLFLTVSDSVCRDWQVLHVQYFSPWDSSMPTLESNWEGFWASRGNYPILPPTAENVWVTCYYRVNTFRFQWMLLREQNGPSGGKDLCGGLGWLGLVAFYVGLHLFRFLASNIYSTLHVEGNHEQTYYGNGCNKCSTILCIQMTNGFNIRINYS